MYCFLQRRWLTSRVEWGDSRCIPPKLISTWEELLYLHAISSSEFHKNAVLCHCLQSYPSHCYLISIKYISMSPAPSILLIRICSDSLFLTPKPGKCYSFISGLGKYSHTHAYTPTSHCTANTITFAAGLQMPLGVQATNHLFCFVSLS